MQNWSTDAADAFCEGAKVMQERVVELKPEQKRGDAAVGADNRMTWEQLWEPSKGYMDRQKRI